MENINCIDSEKNNPSNDSSYNLKHLSFEDSQIDHFVPYSSPYILCWHNNRKKLNDITMYNMKEIKKYDSNISDIEKGRCDDFSSSNLIQITADNTLDLSNDLTIEKHYENPLKENFTIDGHESEIKDITQNSFKQNISLQKEKTYSTISKLSDKLNTMDLNNSKNFSRNSLDDIFKSDSLSEYESTFVKTFQTKSEDQMKKLIEINTINQQFLLISSENNNKENVLNEVSTQTSFIGGADQPLSNKLNENMKKKISNSNLTKRMNKDKIKEILSIQKQQHEKRLKELEKLAAIEKLQAERLKNLMLNSYNDSLLNDSYFNLDNTKEPEKEKMQIDFYNTSLNNILENNTYKKIRDDTFLKMKSEFINETLTDLNSNSVYAYNQDKTSVEVLQLENTSVYVKPPNIFVKKHEINRNSLKESNNKFQNLVNSEPKCWFLPLTPKNQTNLIFKCNNDLQNNETIKKKNQIKFKDYEISNSKNKVDTNMSLQEAFETFKRDLISRSKQRQNHLRQMIEQRHIENELKRQHFEMTKNNLLNNKMQRYPNRDNYSFIFEKNQNELPVQRRRMSVQEIRTQNKKLYERLPEVQKKQEKQRNEDNKKLNRMKYSIFKKSIQQNVLTKGPNFNLKYKALER